VDNDNIYRQQVQLLVRTLPFVAQQPVFALKGGTAINLFLQDMPRLSVDIDIAYLPVEDRPGFKVWPVNRLNWANSSRLGKICKARLPESNNWGGGEGHF
jgi:hypothetical protein